MKKYVALMITLVVFCAGFNQSFAQDNGELGFSYQNKLPENQQGTSHYFNLLMTKGAEQTLETVVKNTTNQKMTIKIKVLDAATTSTGLIDYTVIDKQAGKLYLTDIATYTERIELESEEEKIVKIDLKVPQKGISGVILGGVELSKEEEVSQSETASITNHYSYVYSISLRTNPQLLPLNLTAESSNYQPSEALITTPIHNVSGEVVKQMTIDTQIKKQHTNKTIYSNQMEQLKMAPFSRLMHKVPTSSLKPGNYEMTLKASIGDQTWQWQNQFQVAGENQTLNVNSESQKTPQLLIVIALLLVLGLSSGCWYLKRN